MYQTTIELWNGNIAPCENCGAYDPEINKLITLCERNCENLRKNLTPEQEETLQKYIDCCDEYHLRMIELSFAEGFRLGIRLTSEAFH